MRMFIEWRVHRTLTTRTHVITNRAIENSPPNWMENNEEFRGRVSGLIRL